MLCLHKVREGWGVTGAGLALGPHRGQGTSGHEAGAPGPSRREIIGAPGRAPDGNSLAGFARTVTTQGAEVKGASCLQLKAPSPMLGTTGTRPGWAPSSLSPASPLLATQRPTPPCKDTRHLTLPPLPPQEPCLESSARAHLSIPAHALATESLLQPPPGSGTFRLC